MSYQEKNTTVSLVSSILLLGFFLVKYFQLYLKEGLNSPDVFRLWGIIIVLGIVVNILGTILAHILSSIVQSIQTNGEEPRIDDVEDERDKLIELRGTNVAYIVFSIGVFLSMLTLVIGQPALVMFTLIIFFGLVSQIIGDISRLYLYRRGV